MEELERKRLHWQKVTAVVCILLLIVVTASSALAFVGVRRYAPRIEHIVSRLDTVTAELDALDTERHSRFCRRCRGSCLTGWSRARTICRGSRGWRRGCAS